MAFTEKKLAQSYPNTTTNTTVYTVPAATKAIIKNCLMCNTTASAITVRVFAVPNGGSAGVSNALLYDYSIPANETFTRNMYQVLDTAGDFIVVYVSAQGVTFNISGATIA